MGSRKWWGLVAVLAIAPVCYAFPTNAQLNKMSTPELLKLQAQERAKLAHLDAKAAAQGNALAQFNLGVDYGTGRGVPKDYAKAIYWFHKAARQGNTASENSMGVAYEDGLFVPKNHQRAVYWWQKAAAQGSTKAMINLGYFYGDGPVVPKGFVQAYKWFALAKNAARPGSTMYSVISTKIRQVSRSMSPGQIAQAQAMAASWTKAHEK